MTRHRRFVLIIASIVLLVALPIGASAYLSAPDDQHIYTIAELQARLSPPHSPFVGRTVLVRGRVVDAWYPTLLTGRGVAIDAFCYEVPDSHCTTPVGIRGQPRFDVVLASENWPRGANITVVVSAQTNPIVAIVRQIPLVGESLFPTHRIQWGRYTVYQVTLLPCRPWLQRTKCQYVGTMSDTQA